MFFERRKPLDLILETAAKRSLTRQLNAFDLTMLGIGAVIGTGIFVLTAVAAHKAGPGMMYSFVIAGFVCALTALIYSEIAAMVPVSGSAYTYSYAVLGELIAWMVGWALVLEYAVAAGAVAVGWSGYANGFLSAVGMPLPVALTAGPGDTITLADGTTAHGTFNLIAFLLSLLLPAALLRQHGEWLPAEGFRRVVTQVLGIVTAFTLAHSLTLSLAALGWVTPASRWVEPAIAISVLLAAINNVRPLITRRAWVVGFGFGLIHGFGFAGALGELGLPTTTRLLALVGFNVGVELGQLVVVCAVLPGLFLLRRARWYAGTAMPLLSLAICAVAATWLWQRLPN